MNTSDTSFINKEKYSKTKKKKPIPKKKPQK